MFILTSFTGTGTDPLKIYKSTDMFNWIVTELVTSTNYTALAYGNGIFVGVGQEFDGTNSNKVLYSADGINWSEKTIPARSYRSVAYGNGVFIAAGYDGAVSKSTDGINWTSKTVNNSFHYTTIVYGNGKFILNSSNVYIFSSIDNGENWTASSHSTACLNFENNLFFSIVSNGTVHYSSDALTWTTCLTPTSIMQASVLTGNQKGICYHNNKYYLITQQPGWYRTVSSSSDLITWTTLGSLDAYFSGIFFFNFNGTFFVVSTSASILYDLNQYIYRNYVSSEYMRVE